MGMESMGADVSDLAAPYLVIAVAIAGAGGAVVRAVIERWLPPRPRGLPWGLLLVNILGSAIAGWVAPCTSGSLRVVLLIGLCGALTTYSGFAWRVDLQLRAGERTVALATTAVMVVGCVVAFLATWWLLAGSGSGAGGLATLVPCAAG